MPLSAEKINEIEMKAREVLLDVENENGGVDVPVNLGRIIEKNNLVLKSGDFENDIIGAYDKNKRTIFVSASDPYPRKAFTIAHELGHFFLHKDKESEIYYRHDAMDFSSTKHPDEQEANWFAASLLMPRETVINFWSKLEDVDGLAELFGVSRSAMYFRLKNLKLLNNESGLV